MTKRPIGTVVVKIACALSTYGVMSWNSISAAAENEPITIGAVLPLTGEAAHWGIPPRNAAELAIDQINGAGGIIGRKHSRFSLPSAELCRRIRRDHIRQERDVIKPFAIMTIEAGSPKTIFVK